MFSKPFSLILVYIVTVFNITILALPAFALVIPFIHFNHNIITIDHGVLSMLKAGFFFLVFLVSFLMLSYFLIDLIFGFSMRASLRGCSRYEKIKDYDFLTDLFGQVRDKFGQRGVKLYIKNSDEVNAFAVSSVGRSAIVLTRGLINHYLVECPDPKMFLYALRSVIAHEMSHLVNKDYLPTFLIITNQKATNIVARLLDVFFDFFTRIISFIPYGGFFMARLMRSLYRFFIFLATFFNRFVVYNVYEFLRRFISRSIEFRCDRQSAKAFGGANIALALSMLGESGYFTLFSTHPNTKSRIRKVENIKISDSIVRPGFFDSLANYFSLMFLMIICLFFAKLSRVDLAIREYIRQHEIIHHKLSILWHLIMGIF